ncbi:MAG: tetratricopeptide repeat protein [Myxococcaceae bacterium]|nr:tetratricopeptide repeat protein [Myxococcaceae bacterium]
MTHLAEDVLTQAAAGSLDEAARAAVDAHLERCEPCRALFEEVSSLVNSKTMAAPISSVPAAKGGDTRPDSPTAHEDRLESLQKGMPLGRYVLLERLGAGGMGEVFAAYDPHLDRKVALKLLRTGTVSADEGRARLLREAQAMARLQHPNVVMVHDVGTLRDRVFVAMEFVEGETAGQWMRTPHPWHETLRVFLSAGSGLSAAHRAGIVHRDFKPDNIIIGRDGRPRVLDFGLARQATSSELKKEGGQDIVADSPLGSPLTRDGAVMGTPGYMAPEQLGGLPTDARSDQFSFCVALYEALYGKRPFGGATLKAHATEMVMNQLPPPPAGHEAPESVWAALKRGLQADPKDRYPDMESLLAALEPRRAVVRRTRMAFALVALGVVAALGVGFSVWSTQRLRVCSGAEARLTGVWDAASKDRLKKAFTATGARYAADAFKGVESALDAYTQSWISAEKDSCEAVRIRKTDSEELYQRKTLCLETRLRALRATLALLETADKVVVSNAVSAARGLDRIDDCRDAVALSQGRARPASSTAREETLRNRIIEAKALLDAGKYARGVEVARAAVGGGGSEASLAEAYLLLGRLLTRAGDTKAAESAYFEAAAHAEQSGDAALTARAFSRLFAVTGAIQERFDVAHAWERLATAAATRAGNDPDIEAELASNSGDVALSEERLADAKNDFERALAIRKRYLPENHPDLAMSYSNLGTAFARLRQFDEAERQYQRSYELHLQNEGPDHPNTASSMNNLAVVYRQQGRLSEALDFLQRALKVRETNLGPDHLEVASTRVVLANILERMGDAEAALKLFQSALRTRERALGPEHLQVASVHGEIADLYFSQRAYREALPEAQLALAMIEKGLGPTHATTSNARERVGATYARLGQWRDAQAALKAAYDARREKAGPESVEVARSLNALGDLELEQAHYEKALSYFEQALALREKVAGVSSPSLANDLVAIGRCQLALKAAEKAVAPLERAVALREKSDDAENLAAARFQLAKALWEAGPDGRDRSIQLAEAARTVLRGPDQGDVEKWLASR